MWVEAWIECPDLKGHYVGWQAVDTTPQEPSEVASLQQSFTLGPTPCLLSRKGKIQGEYHGIMCTTLLLWLL